MKTFVNAGGTNIIKVPAEALGPNGLASVTVPMGTFSVPLTTVVGTLGDDDFTPLACVTLVAPVYRTPNCDAFPFRLNALLARFNWWIQSFGKNAQAAPPPAQFQFRAAVNDAPIILGQGVMDGGGYWKSFAWDTPGPLAAFDGLLAQQIELWGAVATAGADAAFDVTVTANFDRGDGGLSLTKKGYLVTF